MLPDATNLNWLEVTGILARLGIEEVERFIGISRIEIEAALESLYSDH